MPADEEAQAAEQPPGGETEPFAMGARVLASDGECGTLRRVVIEPVAGSLTHLVVAPRHAEPRLVPVEMVEAAGGEQISLRCSTADFEALDDADEIQFLPATADVYGYGENAMAFPFYGAGMPRGEPRHQKPIRTDRVPRGEVEVHRGDPVWARDGTIGEVEGLVIDRNEYRVTHVLLKEGHFWGRHQVAIPISSISRVGGEIHVDLSKQEIEELPPVELTSRP